MSFNEIQELIRLINKLKLSEFKLKDGEFEMTVRTKEYSKGKSQIMPAVSPVPSIIPIQQPMVTATPVPVEAVPTAPAAEKAAPASSDAANNYREVRSPIVGTFYRAPAADKPPFVKVGDSIEEGSIVCIVEAMKLFNEIESEVSGTIVKVMVEDAQPVEYDQVLFLVE